MAYYNRYKALALADEVGFFPDIQLEAKDTDKFEIFEVGKSRFDKWSDQYYGEPYFDFLIMLANPEQEGLQFLIQNHTAIRIPFPLEQTLKELKEKIELKKKYYGT